MAYKKEPLKSFRGMKKMMQTREEAKRRMLLVMETQMAVNPTPVSIRGNTSSPAT